MELKWIGRKLRAFPTGTVIGTHNRMRLVLGLSREFTARNATTQLRAVEAVKSPQEFYRPKNPGPRVK